MNFCIGCEQRHIDCKENEVIISDEMGVGLVTYHKDCVDKVKALTEHELITKGYIHHDIARRIVKGIAKGYKMKEVK